jgi:tripartite-type tricarboxylate transporter receptor subunit TctC
MNRHKWLLAIPALLAAVLLFLAAPSAEADKYPSKPIKMIVALGAGGSHDLNSRAIASVAHQYLGQPVIVQLMPGAGGKVGMGALKRAKADGYTLCLASSSHLTVAPHVRNMGFDSFKDFVPVFHFTKQEYMMSTLVKKPWKNFDEFVEAARKNPGKISYASSGVYGVGHLQLLKLQADKGIKLNHIPFKGGGPGIRALLGGHVDAAGGNPATGGTIDHVRAGKMRILAVADKKRSIHFPDAPTFREKGVDFLLASKRFVIVRAGTPQDRIDFLVNGFKKLVKDKTYNRLLKKMGDRPQPIWGKALLDDLRAEYKAFGAILRSIGATKKK